MTEIRETGFEVDLPGTWERGGSTEPGSLVYLETDGDGIVTVMLLAVRPVYAIADRKRLLDDYMQHRSKFEKGQTPSLEQSEPISEQLGESVEGAWRGVDVASCRQRLHRVLLHKDVLADVCYETSGIDEASFDELAEAVLGSARVSID